MALSKDDSVENVQIQHLQYRHEIFPNLSPKDVGPDQVMLVIPCYVFGGMDAMEATHSYLVQCKNITN